MAEPAERATPRRKPRDPAAEAGTQRHEGLEARLEVRAELDHGARLNGGPAAAAQRKAAGQLAGVAAPAPRPAQPAPRTANRTGLPNGLKAGVENLSGLSLDDVKVHYNSARPAALQALAYAQGTDIHLGPGQERHLPHEAWHVVQQAQGRVKPTMQMKGGVAVNDDAGLEHEADVMGRRASQQDSKASPSLKKAGINGTATQLVGWTRWYEFDGTDYIPRFMGLPDPRWIPIGQHEGKDAYISATNWKGWSKITDLENSIATVKEAVDQYTPLISSVKEKIQEQGITIATMEEAQAKFLSLEKALGNYLTNTSTFLKALGAVLGFVVAGTGALLLAYITLPQWLVATVEGLSFLYGVGLLYRWLKSELLPTLVKIPLVTVNAMIMTGTASVTLSQIAAYALGWTTTLPLQHIEFAAIPMALMVEHFIIAIVEKVNALRKSQNLLAGHDEEHED